MKYNIIEDVIKSLLYENTEENRLKCIDQLKIEFNDSVIVCDESNNTDLSSFTVDVDGYRYRFNKNFNGFHLYSI